MFEFESKTGIAIILEIPFPFNRELNNMRVTRIVYENPKLKFEHRDLVDQLFQQVFSYFGDSRVLERDQLEYPNELRIDLVRWGNFEKQCLALDTHTDLVDLDEVNEVSTQLARWKNESPSSPVSDRRRNAIGLKSDVKIEWSVEKAAEFLFESIAM